MVQTIRIFYEKDSEVKSIFIQEFFKMIGCITYSEMLSSYTDLINIEDNYDVNIILDIDSESLEDVKSKMFGDYSDKYRKLKGKIVSTIRMNKCKLKVRWENIMKNIVSKIWRKNEEREIILALLRAYIESNVFLSLYNKGNLKFVHEYYPISGKENDATKNREEANKIMYSRLVDCYNRIGGIMLEERVNSPYYLHSVLFLEYKINGIRKLENRRMIFSTNCLLEDLQKGINKYKDFVRLYYLGGCICEADIAHILDVRNYYVMAIERLKEKENSIEILDFLYYKMGRYYEKSRKMLDEANVHYKTAYEYNRKSYRALYKLAIMHVKERKYDRALLDMEAMNKILHYHSEQTEYMPKQQVYAYKSALLEARVYEMKGDFENARTCYNLCSLIAENESKLYEFFNQEDSKVFLKILQAGMSKQEIQRKLSKI